MGSLPLFSLLQVTARVTKKFILLAKHLACTELSETRRDAGILFDVNG